MCPMNNSLFSKEEIESKKLRRTNLQENTNLSYDGFVADPKYLI